MKSIQLARIVVVADSDRSLLLAARLRRMQVSRVTEVADLDEARRLCRAGETDACVVAFDDRVLDAAPLAAADAPGRDCGVPSLLLAEVVTPYLRRLARRSGYCAAVPDTIAPRMLYRRIGGALQQRRAARTRRFRLGSGIGAGATGRSAALRADWAKPTVH
jgi:hypothetical protein